jgi:hypothetical protein
MHLRDLSAEIGEKVQSDPTVLFYLIGDCGPAPKKTHRPLAGFLALNELGPTGRGTGT